MAHQIRDAVSHDAGLMSEIAVRSKAHWGYSAEFMADCRDELAVLPGDIESGEIMYSVVEQDQVIVGFYALEKRSESEFELEAMFVEPDRIGSGIGRALMDHAVARASRLGGRKLVIQSDPYAERFYRAAGGVVVGTRESFSISGRFLPVLEIDLGEHAVTQ